MEKSFFKMIKYSNVELKGNYWKIHLSPTLNDFFNIITFIDIFLRKIKVDYKYVYTEDNRIWMSSINSPMSQTGKLITIYPKSVIEAKTIMNNIYEQFGDLPGIEILSDKSFKNTKYIWYRWGMHVLDPSIKDERVLNGNFSNNVTDIYKNDHRYISGSELQKKYHVKFIINENSGGNVYLGENYNKEKVIIKEARKNVLINKHISTIKKQRIQQFYMFV